MEGSYKPEKHLSILKNSEFVLIAMDDKKCVGFINAITDGECFAFVPMMEVIPEYRGRGIGSELFARMLDMLRDYTNIDLTCDAKMQSFYEKFGMLKLSAMVIRKYLSDSKENE